MVCHKRVDAEVKRQNKQKWWNGNNSCYTFLMSIILSTPQSVLNLYQKQAGSDCWSQDSRVIQQGNGLSTHQFCPNHPITLNLTLSFFNSPQILIISPQILPFIYMLGAINPLVWMYLGWKRKPEDQTINYSIVTHTVTRRTCKPRNDTHGQEWTLVSNAVRKQLY